MVKISKYAEALGIWEHKIGNIEHKLKPRKSDNLELSKVLDTYRKDKVTLMEKVGDLYEIMVLRDDPPAEEDKNDLKEFIGLNLPKILTDTMLKFKWIDEESLEQEKQRLMEEELDDKKKR